MTEWITHDGNGQPVPDDCKVVVQLRNGSISRAMLASAASLSWVWGNAPQDWDVIGYGIIVSPNPDPSELNHLRAEVERLREALTKGSGKDTGATRIAAMDESDLAQDRSEENPNVGRAIDVFSTLVKERDALMRERTILIETKRQQLEQMGKMHEAQAKRAEAAEAKLRKMEEALAEAETRQEAEDKVWQTDQGVASALREIDHFLSDASSGFVSGISKAHLRNWRAAVSRPSPTVTDEMVHAAIAAYNEPRSEFDEPFQAMRDALTAALKENNLNNVIGETND